MTEEAENKQVYKPRKSTRAPEPITPLCTSGYILDTKKPEPITPEPKLLTTSGSVPSITGDELMGRWRVDSFTIVNFILKYDLPVIDAKTHKKFDPAPGPHAWMAGPGSLFTKRVLVSMTNGSIEEQRQAMSNLRFRPIDIEDFEKQHKSVIEELKKQNASMGDHVSVPGADDKNQIFRKIGKKGGQKEKENKPILEAAKQYLQDTTQKLSGKTNEGIAKKFCNKYKEDAPMSITIDNAKWEVFCQGGNIFSRPGERYDVRKANNKEKSIVYSTFWKNYIPKAKQSIHTSES